MKDLNEFVMNESIEGHKPTSKETRFYIDLQVFFDKSHKYCIDAIDVDNSEGGQDIGKLRGKSLDEVMDKLKGFLADYYEMLEDITSHK